MRISLISRRLGWTLRLLTTLGVVAAGCGGRSEGADLLGFVEDAGAPGEDGEHDAGAPSLAGAGSQSRAGRGSGGRAGVAGASAVTAGRSAGSAGTAAPGGAPSGGRSGAGARGGSTSAAGANTGGASAAGTNTGGASPVAPELLERCDALCVGTTSAHCSASETLEECTVGCRLAVQQPACASSAEKLFDCTASGDFSCSADGRATVVGCEVVFVETLACILNALDNPTLDEPCKEYCAAASSASCGQTPDDTTCSRDCRYAGSLVPACAPLWEGYLACSKNQPSFVCGEDGRPVAQGCVGPLASYAGCVLSAAGQ